MEIPPCLNIPGRKADFELITPDDVRGLSLGEITRDFKTPGLYVRTLYALDQAGLGGNELIQRSLRLGLELHATDHRTNGHYQDHLLRVTLRLIENLAISDPNIIASAPVHDTLEDHPFKLALILTRRMPESHEEALRIGKEALASLTNAQVAHIAEKVTYPLLKPGEDRIVKYAQHTQEIVYGSPEGRAVKLSDFFDNAVNNHETTDPAKRRRLDEKYIGQYAIHSSGLWLPNSIITGKEREWALKELAEGYNRAKGRLAVEVLKAS